jgi:hypothetical protein
MSQAKINSSVSDSIKNKIDDQKREYVTQCEILVERKYNVAELCTKHVSQKNTKQSAEGVLRSEGFAQGHQN